MDYRELLKKYIYEVIKREGITFVPLWPNEDYNSSGFSQEEIDELNKCSDEICKEK